MSEKSATSKEIYNSIKNITLNQGKVMKAAAWSSAYRYAWNKKLIKILNTEERSEYKKSVIEALKSEARANIGAGTKSIKDILNSENSIQMECHRRIMQVHFQEMIDKKENNG